MKKSKILVVEDEKDVQDLMVLHLKREGYETLSVENGEDALRLLTENQYDLVVLDWMLPGLSGLDVCKSLNGKLPVLMVTARADTADIVLGLEMGADDYITKPFEIPVFLARIRSLLRRVTISKDSETQQFEIGQIRLNMESYEVSCAGKPVTLTPSEFKLLAGLLRNTGRVLSRDKLIEMVQGQDVAVTDRTVDTHVFGLRKKLGDCGNVIETIRGVGYRVAAQ